MAKSLTRIVSFLAFDLRILRNSQTARSFQLRQRIAAIPKGKWIAAFPGRHVETRTSGGKRRKIRTTSTDRRSFSMEKPHRARIRNDDSIFPLIANVNEENNRARNDRVNYYCRDVDAVDLSSTSCFDSRPRAGESIISNAPLGTARELALFVDLVSVEPLHRWNCLAKTNEPLRIYLAGRKLIDMHRGIEGLSRRRIFC